MARKPRVEFEGAFYHVIARGNQRQDIFRDDKDRRTYLEKLEHYRNRYRFSVYAYVLMSNHVHLLIETHFGGQFRGSGLNIDLFDWFRVDSRHGTQAKG